MGLEKLLLLLLFFFFALKLYTFIISQFLWIRNVGVANPDGSGTESLIKLQSKCWWELQSSEDFTRAERAISTTVHS